MIMNKTLITTAISAFFFLGPFCGLCSGFSFFAFLGPDKEDMDFVNSAGVVEKFAESKGTKSQDSQSLVSPLVKRAEDFALYLDPPPPKVSRKSRQTRTKGGPRVQPKKVSARFDLIATSYYAAHPEKSMALINQPGKGFNWVRQGGKVGYLIIEEVKGGVVVIRDGDRTYEIEAKRKPYRNLVRGKGPSISEITPIKKEATDVVAAAESSETYEMSQEKLELTERIFAELEAMSLQTEAGLDQPAKSRELIEELMSGLESIRIGSNEAKMLENLGEELKGARRDPNRIRELRKERAEKRKELIKKAKSDKRPDK